MSTDLKENIVDEQEFDKAKQEAEQVEFVYVHKFKKPLVYEGKTYDELTFDWDKLTGRDGLSIENEMQAMNKVLIVPAFSGEYLIRFAAKACTERIGVDIFDVMKVVDYNQIRSAARSFLLSTEL